MRISKTGVGALSSLTSLLLVNCGLDRPSPDFRKGGTPSATGSQDTASETPISQTGSETQKKPGTQQEAGSANGGTDPASTAQAPSGSPSTGSVEVKFTPVRYPTANYPAYVYAIWVTDSAGKYVKTIDARAATRIRYLTSWLTDAGVPVANATAKLPDGNTGASIAYPTAPTALVKTWDLKDAAGKQVLQGAYTIKIQMTSANNAGLMLSVPITVGASPAMKTDSSQTTGITSVSVSHTP